MPIFLRMNPPPRALSQHCAGSTSADAPSVNPGNPNRRLMDFIEGAGAVPDPVLPYVYVSEADDARVLDIINGMAGGEFDAIAFTSAPQVRRLRDVARAAGREPDLLQGFRRIAVAAVGPIVASELAALGVQVSIAPTSGTFFMKPLVRELAAAFTKDGKAGTA